MLFEIDASFFHLDQNNGLPNQVRETDAPTIIFVLANAKFSLSADIKHTRLTACLKQSIEKNLRLPLLVTSNVGLRPSDELC